MFIHRQRMLERTVLAVKATLRVGGRTAEAALANASSRGVLVLVDAPPPRGTAIELVIDGDVIEGQVRWRHADRCGVALKTELCVEHLIEGKIVPLVQVPERMVRRSAMDVLRALLG